MGSSEDRVIELLREWHRQITQYIRGVEEENRILLMRFKVDVFISTLILFSLLIIKMIGGG